MAKSAARPRVGGCRGDRPTDVLLVCYRQCIDKQRFVCCWRQAEVLGCANVTFLYFVFICVNFACKIENGTAAK